MTATQAPTKQLRAAAEALRAPLLPAYLTVPVRVVQGDSERMDTLSWCETQHPDDEDCGACEVVETLHSELAGLIAALLTAREPLAALMDAMANEIHTQGGNPRTEEELAKYGYMVPTWPTSLAAARAILGGGQ
ncbi:hypothetical protein GCM10017559_07990 [Streptosporangium longisporum]|uniref:Uncharacterized protein n=1 Tax=Streptosporangium longisporum TaxID=46187 RepID=A0ABN3XSK6_9ACTN